MLSQIIKRELQVGEIPLSHYEPKEKNGYGIIFYHGWGSDKSRQSFRGEVLALYGYQVFLVDSIYHGLRGEVDYEEDSTQVRLLPEVIIKNLEEYDQVQEFFQEETGVPAQKTYVMGHSMGAMTAGAIISNKDKVAGAVEFNGVMDWNGLIEGLEMEEEDSPFLEDLRRFNPNGKLDYLRDRLLCLLNGEEDQMVPPKVQEAFYHKAREYYLKKDRIYFEKFPLTNHVITTNMLEAAIGFLERYRK